MGDVMGHYDEYYTADERKREEAELMANTELYYKLNALIERFNKEVYLSSGPVDTKGMQKIIETLKENMIVWGYRNNVLIENPEPVYLKLKGD